jgi:trimeric autotransporter adhesin
MSNVWRSHRFTSLAGSAMLAITAGVLIASPVQAQFICVGNATGTTVPPATADGGGAVALLSANNLACGTGAQASGGGGAANMAVGINAVADGAQSSNTAVGFGANAGGGRSGNTAIGLGANASGGFSHNTAIGLNANASGNNTNNVGIGFSATATGVNSTAIGNGASATFANSAAFGNGATATRDNQQVFGTASNTYTMSGIASSASRAAQSGPVQIVTSDASGNLATSTAAGLGLASTADINAINAQLAGINGQLGGINAHLNDLDDRVNRVGALGAALAGLHPNPRAKGDNHISAAFGAYRGQPAFAGGYFRNINNDTLFSVGISTTGKDWSANTGLTFSW